MKEFSMELLEGLKIKGLNVEQIEIKKFNDVVVPAIDIRVNERISQIVYVQGEYEKYCEGCSIDTIIHDICRSIERCSEIRECFCTKTNQVDNFESVKDFIIFKIGRYDWNKEFLEDKPYISKGAFVIFFAVDLTTRDEEEEYGLASVNVTTPMLDSWGISLEDLYEIAIANTIERYPAIIRSLGDIVKEYIELDDVGDVVGNSIYVVSNKFGVNGATVIYYPGFMKAFAKRLDVEKLMIIPSSTEEVLVKIYDGFEGPEALCEMIKEVNTNSVQKYQWLSDKPYLYDRESDSIVEL